MYVLTKQVDMFILRNATAVFASGTIPARVSQLLCTLGETLAPRSLRSFQSLAREDLLSFLM